MENKIIIMFEPMIKKIANTFYGIDKEELMQAGRLGLFNAYNNYRNNKDVKFSTYAYQYIFGEMYLLTMNNRNIKINRDILKTCKLIEKARQVLTQKLNKEPSIEDISSYLEMDINIINYALSMTNNILSLDKEQEEDTNLYNAIGQIENNDLKIDINDSINTLESDEKKIIKLRYFNYLTQAETAKVLNISQVSVCRHEKRSLKKMHEYLYCE